MSKINNNTNSNGKPIIQIVIPAMNEENSLQKVLDEVMKYVDRVLVIDGHSVDNTVGIAKKSGAFVVIQNGRGKGMALRHAFELIDADIVIVMDADGSMRSGEIPQYIKAILSGADFVKGSRFLQFGGSEDLTTLRKLGNILFTTLVNQFWAANYTDLCYGFVAFKKEALKKMSSRLKSNHFDIEAEICIQAKKLRLNVQEVPTYELRRSYGASNLHTILDGARILIRILSEIVNRT